MAMLNNQRVFCQKNKHCCKSPKLSKLGQLTLAPVASTQTARMLCQRGLGISGGPARISRTGMNEL